MRERIYVTTLPGPGAGIGHQSANWNTAYWLAKECGIRFAHQPFSNGWDTFLGFGRDELQLDQVVANPIYLSMLNLDDEVDKFKQMVAEAKDDTIFHLATNQNMHHQERTEEDLRRKYWLTQSPYIYEKKAVAVHTRRNVVAEEVERLLSCTYIIKVLTALPRDYEIHLFSDGEVCGLEQFNLTQHINGNMFSDFNMMASADILVLGRSGFSYLAGLVSRGIKIGSYPWWHNIPDEGKWIRASLEGEFDTTRIPCKEKA